MPKQNLPSYEELMASGTPVKADLPSYDEVIAGSTPSQEDSGPGLLTTLGLAGLSGPTMGVADELYGATQAAFDMYTNPDGKEKYDDLYVKNRDNFRNTKAEGFKQYPIAGPATELLSSFATPMGVLGKTAGLGAKAIAGAGMGALAGFGGSEAQGIDLAKDTATGAGVGAVAGAAIPRVLEAGKRSIKSLGQAATIQDLIKAYQLGKTGQGISMADTRAAGQALVSGAEGLSEGIAQTSKNLAKERAAILAKDMSKYDTRSIPVDMRAKAQEQLLKVGNQGADRDAIQSITDDLFSTGAAGDGMPASEVQKLKKLLNDMKFTSMNPQAKNLATSEGQNIAGQGAKQLDEMLSANNPGYKDANSKMSEIFSTLENLGLGKITDGDVESSALSSKMYDTIAGSLKDNPAGFKASDRFTKIKDMLDKVNPKLKKEAIPQLEKLADQVDLGMKSQTKLTANPVQYVMGNANQVSNLVGKALKPSERTNTMFDSVKSMSGNEGMQAKIADLTSKGKEGAANLLKKIAENPDEKARNALLFSTLQNPQYRAAILDEEAEDGQ